MLKPCMSIRAAQLLIVPAVICKLSIMMLTLKAPLRWPLGWKIQTRGLGGRTWNFR